MSDLMQAANNQLIQVSFLWGYTGSRILLYTEDNCSAPEFWSNTVRISHKWVLAHPGNKITVSNKLVRINKYALYTTLVLYQKQYSAPSLDHFYISLLWPSFYFCHREIPDTNKSSSPDSKNRFYTDLQTLHIC